MNKPHLSKETIVILGLSLAFGCLFWLIESWFIFHVFHENMRFMLLEGPETLLESLFFRVSIHELFIRISFLVFCIFGGTMTAIYVHRWKKSREALQVSESKFRSLVEQTTDMIWEADAGFRVTYVSPQLKGLLGYNPDELIGHTPYHLLTASEMTRIKNLFNEIAAKGVGFKNIEVAHIHKNGEIVILEVSGIPITDNQGALIGYRGVNRDVTERNRHRRLIEVSLKEKEILLREVHHRVKNNLQIIISLLNLSRIQVKDPQALSIIQEAAGRIYAIAMVHMQLYESDQFDSIELTEHIRKLLDHIEEMFPRSDNRIQTIVAPSDVRLSLTRAVPCALMLNELIVNAFKHAFKDGRKGTVRIKVTRLPDCHIRMEVRDDGMGLPVDFEMRRSQTLGMQLVGELVNEQLGGDVDFHRDAGTRVVITFPDDTGVPDLKLP